MESEDAEKNIFQSRESALREELEKLKAEIKQRKSENKDAEEALRKKKVKNESEVEQWISVYDRDMHEKASEMEKESTIYDAERKEMERLEEYFNKLMAEREAQLAEERKKAEAQAREHAQQATLSKAAVMVQKIWNGHKARRELDRMKTGSRGKKGKKGGKGGKGKKKK